MMASNRQCRLCGASLETTFADLRVSPLANAFLQARQLHEMEPFYPLHAYVCGCCLLVQVPAFETPDAIFSDYAYFSSYSSTWLEHCARYAGQMVSRLGLGPASLVVEIASNDGYLLQYFQQQGVPVRGVEPAANVARVAIEKGIPTEVLFLGADTARELAARGVAADLLIGNNVLAHVPDLHSFVAGLKILLKSGGTITLEFPHLLQLLRYTQFDTIYHEHFSYFSLATAERVLAEHGLAVYDVEELPTHGGSLRIYAAHTDDGRPAGAGLVRVRESETAAGLNGPDVYRSFADRIVEIKCALLEFLIECRRSGRGVAGYGAPAKGNTLLNYCGVGPELLPYTVDRNPHKQGLFLPGTHIPIEPPERIGERRPDYVLILPWNLRDEIAQQMAHIHGWGGRFVTAVPSLEVF